MYEQRGFRYEAAAFTARGEFENLFCVVSPQFKVARFNPFDECQWMVGHNGIRGTREARHEFDFAIGEPNYGRETNGIRR